MPGLRVNIGNIYNILGDKNNAEKYWNDAIELNQTIGNLEQEGLILLSYGVFYQENNDFERANECWIRSEKIFSTLGNQIK